MRELTPEEMKQVAGGAEMKKPEGPLQRLITFVDDIVRLLEGGGRNTLA